MYRMFKMHEKETHKSSVNKKRKTKPPKFAIIRCIVVSCYITILI